MTKKINWLGKRWYVEGKSTLGKEYIQLRRVSFMSDLKRYGRVSTVIDTLKADLDRYNIKYQ